MKLTTYTAKRSMLTKKTVKTITGGYDSDENGAEVIMTWEDSNGFKPEDLDLLNELVNKQVRNVLRHQDGKDWLDGATSPDESESVPTGATGAPSKGKL